MCAAIMQIINTFFSKTATCFTVQVNKLDEEERRTVEYDTQVSVCFCVPLLLLHP